MTARTIIRFWQTGNRLYAGADVTFWRVGVDGLKTSTKIPLYAADTGTAQLSNPQRLNSEGRLKQSTFIEESTIATISGVTFTDHDTGIIYSDNDAVAALREDLADSADVTAGASLLGWIRQAIGAVATTVKKWLDWQSLNVFEFMTAAQIAQVQSGVGTLDTALAFRTALTALSTAARGKLIIPAGTYYQNSYDATLLSTDEYVCFAVPSKVKLAPESQDSVVLKLSTTLQGTLPVGTRISVIGTRTGTSGQTIKDLTFDYNGIVLDIPFRAYNAVRSYGARVLMERLTIPNAPGRNMIVVGINALTRTYTTIRNCAITNGAKNVPGNAAADDCSFIYLNGSDNVVEDCNFKNDAAAITNCGGVEVHASNCKVLNNNFENLWPAVYTGVQDAATIAKNTQIKGNTITTCVGGVTIVDRHDGLVIVDNYFDDADHGNGYAVSTPRDDITGVAGAGVQINMKIARNHFKTVTNRAALRLAGCQDLAIQGNSFTGYSSAAQLIASTTELKNILVSGNIFDNPVAGASALGQVHLVGDGAGVWAAAFTDIIVTKNMFCSPRGTAAPANISPMGASGAGGLTFTNCRYYDNEVVVLPDTVGGSKAASIDTTTYVKALTASGIVSFLSTLSVTGKASFLADVATEQAQFSNTSGNGTLQIGGVGIATRGSRLQSSGGTSANFNTLDLSSNATSAGAQANTGFASWRQAVGSGSSEWGGADQWAVGRVAAAGAFAAPAILLKLSATGKLSAADKIFPGTDGGALQATAGIYGGAGVPNNANGNNGDYYFRSDTPGTVNQRIYCKAAGAWVGIL